HFPQFPESAVRQSRRMRGTTELTPPLSVWVSCLADRGGLVSVPGRAHLVGHSRHLLLELAMARPAPGFGDCICGLRALGQLARASKAHVNGPDRAVSRRGRVVDLHLPLARPSMATGSSGDAAGVLRRWPRPPHGCPQFRISEAE